MTQETFMGIAIRELIQSGVSIIFNKRKRYSKHNVSNTFDSWEKVPVLTVQNYDDKWATNFENFIHEYCHYLQWKEQSPLYRDGLINLFLFDLFCQGKNAVFTEEQLWHIQAMELDCEKRVDNLNKRHKLGIDMGRYTRVTNAYIYSYRFSMENKSNMSKVDYTNPKIYDLFQSTLLTKGECQTDMPEYRAIFNSV
jgi:hypothetical protein